MKHLLRVLAASSPSQALCIKIEIWELKIYQELLIQPSGALDGTVGRPNNSFKLHQVKMEVSIFVRQDVKLLEKQDGFGLLRLLRPLTANYWYIQPYPWSPQLLHVYNIKPKLCAKHVLTVRE